MSPVATTWRRASALFVPSFSRLPPRRWAAGCGRARRSLPLCPVRLPRSAGLWKAPPPLVGPVASGGDNKSQDPLQQYFKRDVASGCRNEDADRKASLSPQVKLLNSLNLVHRFYGSALLPSEKIKHGSLSLYKVSRNNLIV